jgi:hypothetical protein
LGSSIFLVGDSTNTLNSYCLTDYIGEVFLFFFRSLNLLREAFPKPVSWNELAKGSYAGLLSGIFIGSGSGFSSGSCFFNYSV